MFVRDYLTFGWTDFFIFLIEVFMDIIGLKKMEAVNKIESGSL